MKEELITFETAKLAKEKGFERAIKNTPRYEADGTISTSGFWDYNLAAPTQSLLQRWLRENMNINVLVVNYYDKFSCVMKTTNDHHRDGYSIKSILTDTYEKALEAGLLEALKMIK